MESEHLGAKMSDEMEKRRSLFSEGLERASISGAAAEAVQRYGSAVKEHSVAYSGMDNEAGIRLTRGLKSVSESKINPDFAENNIKQQAGFSAEIKSAARGNAENIINKKPVRITRTDDLGSVNDQIRDLVEVGPDGRVLPGSGVQMKFVGSDPKALLGKLTSQKYKKYLDADVLLGVADDDYAVLMGKGGSGGIIDQRIAELRKQAQRSEELGNQSIAEGKRKEIAKLRQIRKNLRKSGLTRKEAVDARLNPEISTAKDIAEVANRAGLEQAKYGAAISGSISLISNTVAFLKGDKTFGEAFGSTAAAAGKGAAASYATSFAGATVKGLLQNSSYAFLRSVSKTSLPAQMVNSAISVGKSLRRYMAGEISGAECMREMAQDGVGTIGSALCSTIGVAALPSATPALIGAVTGMGAAMIGYALSTAAYKELSSALKEARLAREERIRVERECAESVRMIRQYRREMEQNVSRCLSGYRRAFESCFLALDEAIMKDDADGFIRSNAELQGILGRKPQISSFDEFDAMMRSRKPIEF